MSDKGGSHELFGFAMITLISGFQEQVVFFFSAHYQCCKSSFLRDQRGWSYLLVGTRVNRQTLTHFLYKINLNQKASSVYPLPLEGKPEIRIWTLHLHLAMITLIPIFQTGEETIKPSCHLGYLFCFCASIQSALTAVFLSERIKTVSLQHNYSVERHASCCLMPELLEEKC